MIRSIFIVILAIALVFIHIGCDKDSSTNNQADDLVGTWLLSGAIRSGVTVMVPSDTMTYNSDNTGGYRTIVGFGWYDFTYRVFSGKLETTRTAGQLSGSVDTVDFVIISDSLQFTDDSDTANINITTYSRL